MLEVTVTYTVEQPEYRVMTSQVRLNTEKTVLTPALARTAATVAFGRVLSGVTVSQNGFGYGYRLYPNSYRKVYNY